MRRRGKLSLIIWCDSSSMGNPRDVPEDLVFCSGYTDKRALSLHQMQQLAVPVDTRDGINDKAYL